MRIGTFLLSALVLGSSCLADTVSLKATFNDNNGLSENVKITAPGYINTGTYLAGAYDLKINMYNSGSPSSTPLTLAQVQASIGGAGSTFQGICIDFTHDISNGNVSNYTVADLASVTSAMNGVGISSAQALAISYLWDNAPPLTAAFAARLQMAVWDVIYDPTNTGSLFSNNANVAGAQSDAIAAETWAAANPTATPDVYAVINTSQAQSFSFLVGATNEVVAVPVPSAFTSGLLVLGVFGSLRLVKRRQSN